MIEIRHDVEATSGVVFVDARADSMPGVGKALRMAVAGEGVRLVVDFGDRRDTSSDLLFRVHRLAAQLRRLGGSLAVVSPQPSLRRLFDLTLLSQAFPVFATRDEALRNWR